MSEPFTDIYHPEGATPPAGAVDHPRQIGRYRIERLLGQGGFGLVYRAHDEQLQRPVAIKVPHRERVATAEEAAAYLAEARAVAHLDHPHIVPVFDVGSTPDCPCYIVSKLIDGCTLAQRIKNSPLTVGEAAEVVAAVAEALHHAHRRGLVHRDIKPSNILLDRTGRPFVVDFGVALKEENVGHGPRYAGTPAYMSPEQARGEGHRVDGRSDVFSLGVVLYELLCGRPPFRGGTQAELLEQITSFEPRPPRQYDDAIPKELDRICLKALSKRAAERYSTALDLADDLRHFLSQQPSPAVAALPVTASLPPPTVTPAPACTPPTPASFSRPLRIVPKGLRSFDAHDADFFLELLPGPRDRDGLPDVIRFWKTRLEATAPDDTFSVGLLYGPSGCGKSSLVKAGLLPLLADRVLPVYFEATADETETRLLNGLRQRLPTLPEQLGLKESLAAVRRGHAAGKKIVLVLDQFEQWLHARRSDAGTELVQALRQCDGVHLQCIVMVRDDFWLAVSRFLRELEIRLVEGQNSALVDLFDVDHARKVLTAFGRAFGKLPETSAALSKEQKEYLTQAVAGLAQEGKVISVRLALFAEMMKSKAWTPATLRQVGGTAGVGVTFLDETFSAVTAPPEHRYHQKAARAVLGVLLPEAGTDIKGHMRSRDDLLEASGYRNRPRDFEDLLRILDRGIRLITPTDPGGLQVEEGGLPMGQAARSAIFYQLTHDYLVPSLRDWLTRKRKETRRGRAELLLADRASVWQARPENRQLPSLWQWLQIKWLTTPKHWTPPERKMMARARRYHAARTAVAAVLLAAAVVTGLAIRAQVVEQRQATQAAGLVQSLLNADTAQVPALIAAMSGHRRWVDPLLHEEGERASAGSRQRLHASLALLPIDAGQVDYLLSRLLDAAPHEVPVIRDALAPHADAVREKLWLVLLQPAPGKEAQRLRAAAALACYDPDSQNWAKAAGPVSEQLVAENPVFLSCWMEAFRPVKGKLLAALGATYRGPAGRESERALATSILADYGADQPEVLAELIMDADDKQFALLFPKLQAEARRGLPVLSAELDRKPPSAATDDARERLARRQANAAVALLKLTQPARAWTLLAHSPEPRARSCLIHRLGPLGVEAAAVVGRLNEERDDSIRRALLLSLRDYSDNGLSSEARLALLPRLQVWHRRDPDPGLHAAVEWLLRQWQQTAWLDQAKDEAARDDRGRRQRLEQLGQLLAQEGAKAPPQWYVNGQGQTMVVVPGPVEFLMGSPATEPGRRSSESQHRVRIGRTFAVAARHTTVAEFRRFDDSPSVQEQFARRPDCPIVNITWYQAAEYCNWLSKVEGIPPEQWCYENQGLATTLRANYLSLRGYRLPTEAEMEYASRAGALTSRHYGDSEELLSKYAWWFKNSDEKLHPAGVLRPNDLGLFDVHANAYTWCQERSRAYPAVGALRDDREDVLTVVSTAERALRGGAYVSLGHNARSAHRNSNVPTIRNGFNSIRPTRTIPPGVFRE